MDLYAYSLSLTAIELLFCSKAQSCKYSCHAYIFITWSCSLVVPATRGVLMVQNECTTLTLPAIVFPIHRMKKKTQVWPHKTTPYPSCIFPSCIFVIATPKTHSQHTHPIHTHTPHTTHATHTHFKRFV